MYIIGIPKEIKQFERRVSLVPSDIRRILKDIKNIAAIAAIAAIADIIIYVQSGAGLEAGYSDTEYIDSGAMILDTIDDIYDKANIIVKVKEPQPREFALITSKHTIFAFFHFASNNELIHAMFDSGANCYAYETIKDDKGLYPILTPMSIIAGTKSMIEADRYLKEIERKNIHSSITIIGVGNVGKAAADQAILLGYKTIYLIDKDYDKIKKIEESNPSIYKAFVMNEINLKTLLIFSNVVISSIYSNGEKASKVITNKLLDLMSRSRTIIMDVAIDQGGTTEQSVPMTFKNPVVRYKNTVIYCVPNIPSSAPVEASILLSNSIYPYLLCFLCLDSNSGDSCDSSDSGDYNGYRKRFDELQKGLYVNNTYK
jgi:alanine dehydrogenase